jgi:ArsR family transcriptional regulator
MAHPPLQELNLLHANICQALADPKRILILYALDEQPRHVSALADDLGIPQPTVSRHLSMLRQQSLVVTERDGPSVVYRLVDQRVITALDLMRQVMFDGLQRQSGLMEASALFNQPGGENGTT